MGSRWAEQNGTMNFRQDTPQPGFLPPTCCEGGVCSPPGRLPSLNAPRVLDHRGWAKACLPVSCNSKTRWLREVTICSFCSKQNKGRHKILTPSPVTHHVHRALAALSRELSHFWTCEVRRDAYLRARLEIPWVSPSTARMVHLLTVTSQQLALLSQHHVPNTALNAMCSLTDGTLTAP